MTAISNKFRLNCEYVATVQVQYELDKNKLNPDKVDWRKEAQTLLEFLNRYALPEFNDALKTEILSNI